jgi:hypothetical protein
MDERGKVSRRGFVGVAAGTAAATTLGPLPQATAGTVAETVTCSCRGT